MVDEVYIKIFQCLYILREAGYLFLSANIYERSKLCADIYSYSGRLQSCSKHSVLKVGDTRISREIRYEARHFHGIISKPVPGVADI